MRVNVETAVSVLSRTPSVLRSLLKGLPDGFIGANEGPNTFAPFDVVGHLIHGEKTDWIPRARIILERGESETFAPFDRYAQFEASRGKGVDELLDEFARLRDENLATLKAFRLTEEDFAKTGTHPAVGRVTLGELLATWVVHDLGHIAQITRTMAKQYADEVGPWRAHVPVLDDRRDGPLSR